MSDLISIIILNWNGRVHLKECLDSVYSQTYKNIEIIFVDNNSSDGSVEFIKLNYKNNIQVYKLDKNYGFAKGNNYGIKKAKGSYILLLNNDTQMKNDFVEKMYIAIKENKLIGSVSSKMLFYNNRKMIDNVGVGFKKLWGLGYKIGWKEIDNTQYKNLKYIFGACAGAGLYKTELFEDVGLFDEYLGTNNEDIDLSFRAQLKGYKCIHCDDAVVYHKVSATAGIKSKFTIYHTQRNLEIVWIKNMPSPYIYKYGVFHMAYSFLSLIKQMFLGNIWIGLKAKFDFIKNIKLFLEKRKKIQSSVIVLKNEILNIM